MKFLLLLSTIIMFSSCDDMLESRDKDRPILEYWNRSTFEIHYIDNTLDTLTLDIFGSPKLTLEKGDLYYSKYHHPPYNGVIAHKESIGSYVKNYTLLHTDGMADTLH
jgi:hypothetical protein